MQTVNHVKALIRADYEEEHAMLQSSVEVRLDQKTTRANVKLGFLDEVVFSYKELLEATNEVSRRVIPNLEEVL